MVDSLRVTRVLKLLLSYKQKRVTIDTASMESSTICDSPLPLNVCFVHFRHFQHAPHFVEENALKTSCLKRIFSII